MGIISRIKDRFTTDGGGGYAETSEKKTTLLGYILLFVMFVFLVGVGQTVFGDLRSLVDRPERPTNCAQRIVNSGVEDFRCNTNRADCGCNFNDIDRDAGLQSVIAESLTELARIDTLNDAISDLDREISVAERSRQAAERQYELQLNEQQAGVDTIIEPGQEAAIVALRADVTALQAERASLVAERSALVSEVEPRFVELEASYDAAVEMYERELVVYKLIVFLLSLLFIVPVFVFALRKYLKAKRADSPYTIIFTAFMAAAAILLLQVVLMFLYEILPLEWLESVLTFLVSVPFFRFIFYYAMVALVVALFGGIVFFIQRRIFNEKRVALRRLKKNECPRCTFTIHHRDKHCPGCGLTLREPCATCGEHRSAHTEYCSHCGAGRSDASNE
jgi:hypothetical protein